MTKIYNENIGLLEPQTEKEINQEFLTYIRKHQENVYGYETYGDGSEFYDEDGCVLFTIRVTNEGDLAFKFSDCEDDIDYILKIHEVENFHPEIYKKPSYA